jgi:hypothetical protein
MQPPTTDSAEINLRDEAPDYAQVELTAGSASPIDACQVTSLLTSRKAVAPDLTTCDPSVQPSPTVWDSASSALVIQDPTGWDVVAVLDSKPKMNIRTGNGNVAITAKLMVRVPGLARPQIALVAPTFHHSLNLLPTGMITTSGHCQVFQGDKGFILRHPLPPDILRDTLATATRNSQGLYVQDPSPRQPPLPSMVAHAALAGKTFTGSLTVQQLLHARTHATDAKLASMTGLKFNNIAAQCIYCIQGKDTKARRVHQAPAVASHPCDYMDYDFIANKTGDSVSPEGYTTAVVVYDRYSKLLVFIPLLNKKATTLVTALTSAKTRLEVLSGGSRVNHIHSDSEPQLIRQRLCANGVPHKASFPHSPLVTVKILMAT